MSDCTSLLKKNYRHHQNICNGFTGYNGTCTGFNGDCNVGLCWLLVSSIGGLLKPIHTNGICPKTQYRKPFQMVLMVKSWWFVMCVMVFVEFSVLVLLFLSVSLATSFENSLNRWSFKYQSIAFSTLNTKESLSALKNNMFSSLI